jgi:hypothetical protein
MQYIVTGEPYDQRGLSANIPRQFTSTVTDVATSIPDAVVEASTFRPPVRPPRPGITDQELMEESVFALNPAVRGAQAVRPEVAQEPINQQNIYDVVGLDQPARFRDMGKRALNVVGENLGLGAQPFAIEDPSTIPPRQRPFLKGVEAATYTLPIVAAFRALAGRTPTNVGRADAPFAQNINEATGRAVSQIDRSGIPEVVPANVGQRAVQAARKFTKAPTQRENLISQQMTPFERMAATAAQAPREFYAREASMAGGAGVGAGLAELYDPGDNITSLAAQLVGGVLSPTSLILGLFGKGKQIAKTGVEKIKDLVPRPPSQTATEFSDTNMAKAKEFVEQAAARQNVTAQQIEESIEAGVARAKEAGVDIEDVGLSIAEFMPEGAPKNFVAGLENTVNKNLGAAPRQRRRETWARLNEKTNELMAKGDTGQEVLNAAQVRSREMTAAIDQRVDDAVNDLTKKLDEFGSERTLRQASQAISDQVNNVAKDVRTLEKNLWMQVPIDMPIKLTQSKNAFNELMGAKLPEQPSLFVSPNTKAKTVERFFTARKEPGMSVNVGEALRIKSYLGELFATAKAQGDNAEAQVLGRMLGTLSDDIAKVDDINIQNANKFTSEIYDRISRTFLQKLIPASKTVPATIPPSQVGERILTGRPAQVAQRFEEVENLGSLRDRQAQQQIDAGIPTAPGREPVTAAPVARDLSNETEQFLRDIIMDTATRARGGTVGEPSIGSIEKTLRTQQEVLSNYPNTRQLANDIVNLAKARDRQKGLADAQKREFERNAVRKLTKFENPQQFLSQIWKGFQSQQQYSALAKMAKDAGEETVNALKAETIKEAFLSAERNNIFDVDALINNFKQKRYAQGRNKLDVMENAGVLGEPERKRLEQFLDMMKDVRQAQTANVDLVEMAEKAPNTAELLALRILGASGGSAAGTAVGSSNTLIASGAGAQFAKQFATVPSNDIADLLQKAVADKDLWQKMMKQPSTVEEARIVSQQLFAYLYGAGLMTANQYAESQADQ